MWSKNHETIPTHPPPHLKVCSLFSQSLLNWLCRCACAPNSTGGFTSTQFWNDQSGDECPKDFSMKIDNIVSSSKTNHSPCTGLIHGILLLKLNNYLKNTEYFVLRGSSYSLGHEIMDSQCSPRKSIVGLRCPPKQGILTPSSEG